MDDVETFKAQYLLTETQKKLTASDEKLRLSESKQGKMQLELDRFHSEINNLGNAKPNLITNIIIMNNQKKNQKAMETQARNKEKLKNAQISKSKEKAVRGLNICPSPAQPKSLFPDLN